LGKSIKEIERMDNRELLEWMAFYNIEPFGEERMDLRFALMTAHLISPYLKKGHKIKLKDFMLDFEPKKAMTAEEIKAVLMGVANG